MQTKALGALASLLMLIEGGTPWPQQLLPSRAHLLNKDPFKATRPFVVYMPAFDRPTIPHLGKSQVTTFATMDQYMAVG